MSILLHMSGLNARFVLGQHVFGFKSKPQRTLLPCSGRHIELPPRALIDRRDALNKLLRPPRKMELASVLYAYGTDNFIVCTTTGISEAGQAVMYPWDCSNCELGEAVYDAILQCYAFEPPSASDATLENWSAFQISGAQSGRAFETALTYISIATVKTAIVVEARRRKPLSKIYVGCTLSITGDSEGLGASVREAMYSLRLLQDQHIV